MGGRGSGRSPSYGWHVSKCHEYHAVDIAWLVREGLLKVGRWSTVTWSSRGKETGSIRIDSHPDFARMIYRTRERGGEWQGVQEDVPVVETATNFGGRRKWFVCLSCRRRCRILYGETHFRCRRCHNLKYESQYENAIGRAADRRHALRKRLGYEGSLDEPFPPKPKGMHWKTYFALERADEQLGQIWAERTWEWLRRTDPLRR